MSTFEKWIWIELIGFDNEQHDYGVASYIESLGFTPHSLSLLLYSPDFVHTHENMEEERMLPKQCCSYVARPYSRERERQNWTNVQLRGLINELQTNSIDVYCSFFNMVEYLTADGEFISSAWAEQHSYLFEMNKSGESIPCLNPLKRLEDGSYYEDFFIQKLSDVMRDYQFNGYHGADGYTSPRITLAESDYSDDMVEQFIMSGNEMPAEEINLQCDGNPEELARRGEWIWMNRRKEWIQFYSDKWESFWRKIIDVLHNDGRKVVFNTAWTKDPFEALYRYGVDYKRIASAGIDAFIVESVTSSLTLGASGMEMDPHYDFMAMLMLIKAYVPDTKLICLNAIQDTTERWDTLRHAPTLLERDIYALSNVFYVNDQGELSRCCAGFAACLSDGIRSYEWEWIQERWNLGFEADPIRLLGASLVWSDRAFENQLDDYMGERSWPAHKLTHELTAKGAPIYNVVNIRDIDQFRGTLLVPNPHLLPEEELEAIMKYDSGPVILIGHQMPTTCDASIQFVDNDRPYQLICTILNREGLSTDECTFEQNALNALTDQAIFDPIVDQDPGSWVHSLPFQKVSDSFLFQCARVIAECADSPKIVQGADAIKVIAMKLKNDEYRLIIGNDHINYKEAQIEMEQDITKAVVCTDFPGMPIKAGERSFQVRVPGRGMVIVNVH